MNINDAILRCKSEEIELPNIIDSNAGLYSVEDLNVIGIPSWNRIDPIAKRKAILKISSYRGISSDAIHYYGRIVIDGVYKNPTQIDGMRIKMVI